jgi:hypothetical protein
MPFLHMPVICDFDRDTQHAYIYGCCLMVNFAEVATEKAKVKNGLNDYINLLTAKFHKRNFNKESPYMVATQRGLQDTWDVLSTVLAVTNSTHTHAYFEGNARLVYPNCQLQPAVSREALKNLRVRQGDFYRGVLAVMDTVASAGNGLTYEQEKAIATAMFEQAHLYNEPPVSLGLTHMAPKGLHYKNEVITKVAGY